jgi:hypothetical protein
MVAKVFRKPTGHLDRIEIICDAEGCDTASPDDTEVIAAGGLKVMGWTCTGGSHLCPKHHLQEKK